MSPVRKPRFLLQIATSLGWGAIALNLVGVSVGITPAFGQADPSIGSSYNPNTAPPTLTSLQATQIAGNYQRCMQQANTFSAVSGAGSILSAVSGGSGKGSASLNGDCQSGGGGKGAASDDVPSDSPSCSMFESSAGVYSADLLKQKEAQIQSTIAVIACKQGKLTAIRQEISCLTTQANLINQQIQQIQQPFLTKLQQMSKDMSTLSQEVDNRKAQLDDTNLKLNGSAGNDNSPGSGALGIRGQQQKTRDALTTMGTEIQGIVNQQSNVALQTQAFNDIVSRRTMALTSTCFQTTPVPGFQCALPGAATNPTQSPMNYLLCRYQQNQTRLSANGTVENNNATLQAQGNQASQQLQSLLSQIMSQAPSSTTVPSGADIFTSGDNGYTLLTAADVETQFGAQLQALNGKGINVHDFVMKYIGQCFQKATAQVANERISSSSTLGKDEAQIKLLQANVMQAADDLMKKYSQLWSDDMKALTGQSVPLNITNCIDSQPQVQSSCLSDIQTNMNGILNGNTNNSAINITIQGTNASQNISFVCNGLNGCAASLQNLTSNLIRETQKINQFRTNYATQSDQSIDQYVAQMRQAMSPQSAALQTQLQSINTQLATLGVSTGIDIKAVGDGSPIELTKDPAPPEGDGLYQPPKSLINLIGSGTTPPLLDVSTNNFSSALGGIATAVSDEQSKMGKAVDYASSMVTIANGCKQTDIEAKAKNYDTDVQQLQNLKCSASYQWCTSAAPGELSGLADSVSKALQSYNVPEFGDITGVLQGAAGACSATTNNLQSLASTLVSLCGATPPVDNQNWKSFYKAAANACKSQINTASNPSNAETPEQSSALSDLSAAINATNGNCSSIYDRLNSGKDQLVNAIQRMNAGSAGQ